MKPLLGTLLFLSAALVPPAPSASASAGAVSLDEALLDDMLTSYLGHEPSSCHGGSKEKTTSFTFDWPGPSEGSEWYPPHAGFERDLFLAEMSHNDTNAELAGGHNATTLADSLNLENIRAAMYAALSTSDSFPEENLSYLKTAWQSTTAYDGVASRAVDGNTDGNYGESPREVRSSVL